MFDTGQRLDFAVPEKTVFGTLFLIEKALERKVFSVAADVARSLKQIRTAAQISQFAGDEATGRNTHFFEPEESAAHRLRAAPKTFACRSDSY